MDLLGYYEPVINKNDVVRADLKRHHTRHNFVDFIGQHKLLFAAFWTILDACEFAKLLREVIRCLSCSTTNLEQE